MRRRYSSEEHEEQHQSLLDKEEKFERRASITWKNHILWQAMWWLWTALAVAVIVVFVASFPPNSIPNNEWVNPQVAPSWQSVVADTGLVYPLMGGGVPLLHKWTLSSTDGVYQNIPIQGEPGDIITDLMKAHLLDEPYMDRNFLQQMHVWTGNMTQTVERNPSLYMPTRTWVYETELFILPSNMMNNNDQYTFLLVVEGIKMGASLCFNDKHLGNVTNQFLRYTYEVTPRYPNNMLSIMFDPSINTDGRFAGYSGGWDWAAYIPVGDARGSRYWTFGIFKSIYIVAVKNVYISNVVPKVYYSGKHPTRPMWNGPDADFDVSVQVHVVSPGRRYSGNDELFVNLGSDFTAKQVLPIPAMQANQDTVISFNMSVSKNDIELWWPNGMGSQRLYSLKVHLQRQDATAQTSPAIRQCIGFRTAALVTIDDTNTTALEQAHHSEGTGTHGMYFRVNGALLWARGANVIPMDQLEGRLDGHAHRELVRSAAAANMNMLRIWGGGMILPREFYEACDEYGILLFHDLMFVQEHFHGAVQNPTVDAELRHVIRSLASHTSIVLWNGCNECASTLLFASFVMRVVAAEDDTRAIWPNSPSSSGWATGVRTLDGRPNGNALTLAGSRNGLERHGPYGHSYSLTFPTVNSVVGGDETNTPPKLQTVKPIGPMCKNQFVSEFGASVMSSFESMSGTLSPKEWNIHGSGPPARCIRVIGHDLNCVGRNVMSQRNYACDSHILNFFGSIPFEKEFGAHAFQAQLYECMMGQALWMKGQFEILRSQNSFGALIWQLNENWPTGGWGSIEYGTPSVPGQVIGGRWKPLMHLFQNSLLGDVFATCGQDNACFVKNDGMDPVHVVVYFEYWLLSEAEPIHVVTHDAFLEGGIAAIERFAMQESSESSRADVILIRVQDKDNDTIWMKDNAFLFTVPKSIPGLASQNVTIATSITSSSNRNALVSLQSDALALYVTLTTRAQGRFSENAIHLRPNQEKVVEFLPPISMPLVNVDELRSTLRVEHLGLYLQSNTTHDSSV